MTATFHQQVQFIPLKADRLFQHIPTGKFVSAADCRFAVCYCMSVWEKDWLMHADTLI
jgi:hypothetical protein